MSERNAQGERTAVEHQAWEGYKFPFYLTVALGVLFLILVFTGVL